MIDDFSSRGWPIGVRVVQGGGCKSDDPDCFCAERLGRDPAELWAVVDVFDIDAFDADDTRPRVLACGCLTREEAEQTAVEDWGKGV